MTARGMMPSFMGIIFSRLYYQGKMLTKALIAQNKNAFLGTGSSVARNYASYGAIFTFTFRDWNVHVIPFLGVKAEY